MKKTWMALTALLLSASMTVPALASELLIAPNPNAAAQTALSAGGAYPKIQGLDFAVITSSFSNEIKDTTAAVDGLAETACTFTATASATTLSVYVTSHAPYVLSAVAGLFDEVVPAMAVYGTDDYGLTEWTAVPLAEETSVADGFTVVCAADENAPAYRFYRVDMTVGEGETVSLTELVVYRPEGKLRVPIYNTADGVDADEVPIGYRYVGGRTIIPAAPLKVAVKPVSIIRPAKTYSRPTSK